MAKIFTKRITLIIAFVVSALVGIVAFPWQTYAMTVERCKAGAGDLYDQISSVKAACDNAADINNWCAIWISDAKGNFSPVIKASRADEDVTVYFAGGCSRGHAWATDVKVTNLCSIEPVGSNCSVAETGKVFLRGALSGYDEYWGESYQKVGYTPTTLHVGTFIYGVTPEKVTVGGKKYNSYTQTAAIYRCHGETDDYGNVYNSDACGTQYENITVLLELNEYTLSGSAVKENGAAMSGVIGGTWSSTVTDGSTATVTAGTAPGGWTFKGWREGAASGSYLTTSTSYSTVLTNNKTVYAVYARNEFKGVARADAGASITSGAANTGWTTSNKTVDKVIPCANNGCKGSVDLHLKTTNGSGKTAYGVGILQNNGTISWTPVTGLTAFAPSSGTNGSSMGGAADKTLYPGQKICYYLKFKPYGGATNDSVSTIGACAKAAVSKFKGKSSVSGAASGTTGFKDTNASSTYYASNCSKGCKVTLSHDLSREEGAGSTGYKVSRTSNLTYTNRGIPNNDNLASGTFSSTSGTVRTGEYTIYPGMVVCEKLTFKPNNDTVNKASDVSTTICASALGDAQPSDPSDPDKKENPNGDFGDDSFVNIKVRNQNVALYNDYQRTVYAKPGDKVFFRSSYNPVLQYTYFLTPQQMRIDSGTVYSGGGNSLGALYNANKGARNPDLKNWNNGYAVQKTYDADFSSNDASTLQSLTYDPGDSSKQRSPDYPHSVGVGDVGRSIDARAITNLNATVQTTPGQVTFTNNGGNNLGNVITDARYKIAYAKVPYNYDTDLRITTTPEDKTLYAGEGDQKVNMEIVIKPKENKQTMNSGDSDYSTKIGNPRYKVIVYRPEENTPTTGTSSFGGEDICYGYFGIQNNEVNCGYSVEVNGESASRNVNENPKYHEDNVKPIESPAFNVQDLEAGQKICIAAAFWPSSSGADTSMDADGSHTWRISDSVCFTIAKKPTMQIWGGTISTAGSIGGAITTKNNFAGRNYSVGNSNGTSYTFGSWDEIGVFSAGVVNSFGSGASMGFSKMNGRDFTHDLGGYAARSTSHPPCEKLNTLTIAADKNGDDEDSNKTAITCTKDIDTNQTNGYSDISSQVTQEKSALIGMFMVPVKDAEGNEKLASGDVTLDDGEHNEWKNSVGAHYYHGKDSLTVPQQSVVPGTTHVIHSEANISITGNLIYDQASGYQKLSDVSKLVIYAQGNIYINCNVNRVDAMLIADGTVVTCGDNTTDLSDSAIRSNINNPANSNPLVINGTIVAGRLIANRTYGMATGTSSVIPAEIINYDPTLYLWGADKMDVTSTGKVHITYSKELPPRY